MLNLYVELLIWYFPFLIVLLLTFRIDSLVCMVSNRLSNSQSLDLNGCLKEERVGWEALFLGIKIVMYLPHKPCLGSYFWELSASRFMLFEIWKGFKKTWAWCLHNHSTYLFWNNPNFACGSLDLILCNSYSLRNKFIGSYSGIKSWDYKPIWIWPQFFHLSVFKYGMNNIK